MDRGGRRFILHLERTDAELCIEILDRVCRDLHLLPHLPASDGFLGYRRAQTQHQREVGLLYHVEETYRMSWTTARFCGNNRKN